MRNASPNLLYPPFWVEMILGLERARKAGLALKPFETYRSFARQDTLYQQGRTTPGALVTHSKPGDSWHHYGVAMDVALFVDGKWSWDFDPLAVSKFFEGLAVTWGGKNDGPHYQWKHLPPLSSAKLIIVQGGLLEFWDSLKIK